MIHETYGYCKLHVSGTKLYDAGQVNKNFDLKLKIKNLCTNHIKDLVPINNFFFGM